MYAYLFMLWEKKHFTTHKIRQNNINHMCIYLAQFYPCMLFQILNASGNMLASNATSCWIQNLYLLKCDIMLLELWGKITNFYLIRTLLIIFIFKSFLDTGVWICVHLFHVYTVYLYIILHYTIHISHPLFNKVNIICHRSCVYNWLPQDWNVFYGFTKHPYR